jgi:hypothetical protein
LNSTTQFISILIILLALATYLILTQTIRRRRTPVPLRPVPAYTMLPLMVGEAIEADRPVQASFGHTGLGGTNTVLTLAAAELFYQLAQRTATGDFAPIVTMSDPSTLPLAYGTLRRAYASRDRMDRYQGGAIRWYPSGSQTLAFAAALTATTFDERVSSSVFAGSFGPELALILDATNRRGGPSIAHSAALDGQAIAFAMSDYPLIGEQVFTAGGYLGESASQKAAIATTDVLRWLLIAGILIPAANALTHGALYDAVLRLIGGR